jgi:hypothetical protein
MPMDRGKYHPEWDRISRTVRTRQNDRCKLCGLQNGVVICRNKMDSQSYTFPRVLKAEKVIQPGNAGKWSRPIRVILTVHHITGDTRDNRAVNLIALCQRCHLILDLPFKLKRRKEGVGQSVHVGKDKGRCKSNRGNDHRDDGLLLLH